MSELNIKVYSSSHQGFFVTSTIVYGKKEAVLFDAQLLQNEAQNVVDMIKGLNRELKAIFISHAHADHYFGLQTFIKAFPEAKVLSHPSVVHDAKKTTDFQIMGMKQIYKNLIPDSVPIPKPYEDLVFRIEDREIQVIANESGDIAPATAYFIPTIKTMIAGDIVFDNIHPWTVETDNKGREQWMSSIVKLKSYQPEKVIAGHQDENTENGPRSLDFMVDYLGQFNRAVEDFENSQGVIQYMLQQFPTVKKIGMLYMGAKKNKGENLSFDDFFIE